MKHPLAAAALITLCCSACTQHKVETTSDVNLKPIEIKPIHITIDINVKVDRELDNFFGDLDKNKK